MIGSQIFTQEVDKNKNLVLGNGTTLEGSCRVNPEISKLMTVLHQWQPSVWQSPWVRRVTVGEPLYIIVLLLSQHLAIAGQLDLAMTTPAPVNIWTGKCLCYSRLVVTNIIFRIWGEWMEHVSVTRTATKDKNWYSPWSVGIGLSWWTPPGL